MYCSYATGDLLDLIDVPTTSLSQHGLIYRWSQQFSSRSFGTTIMIFRRMGLITGNANKEYDGNIELVHYSLGHTSLHLQSRR